jgi:hypothetical protein
MALAARLLEQRLRRRAERGFRRRVIDGGAGVCPIDLMPTASVNINALAATPTAKS